MAGCDAAARVAAIAIAADFPNNELNWPVRAGKPFLANFHAGPFHTYIRKQTECGYGKATGDCISVMVTAVLWSDRRL
ncbi:MAG: hypothetical protein WDO19_14070 [Bacteroidota bacterium]